MNDTSNITQEDKVADALKHSWVYRLPKWVWPYAQLARWERPIGWQLLMWPCWWSLMLSQLLYEATLTPIHPLYPSTFTGRYTVLGFIAFLFIARLLPLMLGAMLMRGAGCTYNDLADTDIDEKVERTRSRPLPSGRVSKKSAAIFLLLQCFGGLAVLLYLSNGITFAFWVGAASLATVAIYPFMKRITWWPQLFLGFAFSWGALMGWVITYGQLSLAPILLYIGTIFWVIGYDTIYAHQDREDDAIVGVKSTARLFGEKSKMAIAILYALALGFFFASYWMAVPLTNMVAIPAYMGLAIGALHMFWQIKNLDIHDGDQCLKLFKSNSRFGFILFAGLTLSVLISVF